MKKILLFSLIVCLGMFNTGAFAVDNCMGKTVNYHGNQSPSDNEFLYENQTQYDRSLAAYNNRGGLRDRNSGDGHAYECDNSACPSGYKLTMKRGHVFKGNVVNREVTYECVGSRKWQPIAEEPECITPWGNITVGMQLEKTIPADECSKFDKTEPNINLVEEWNVICRAGPKPYCKPAKCKEGYKLDLSTGRCNKDCPDCNPEPNPGPNPKPNPGPNPGPNPTPNPTPNKNGCEENDGTIVPVGRYSNYDSCPWDLDRDGAALCSCQCIRLDNGGLRWKCDVNKCKGDSESVYHYNKDKTNVTGGKGVCEEKVKPDDTSKPCTPSGCKIKVEQGVKCPNGNYLSETQTFEVCKEDLGTIECDKFQMKVNDCRSTDCVKNLLDRLKSYDDIIERVCKNGSSPVNVPGRDSEGDVVKAQKTLDDFYAYAKGNRSVWKDGEGKFNTTRLASDLTAGVVLGTVGGVVSGVVIKKKQVEKGFDALHCTVGGQTVADWGDTFNVGLR